jgi:hypothetical protein
MFARACPRRPALHGDVAPEVVAGGERFGLLGEYDQVFEIDGAQEWAGSSVHHLCFLLATMKRSVSAPQ